MFEKKTNRTSQLDRIGRMILQAGSDHADAAEAAAQSPFVYTRIRAAIAEQSALADSGGWMSLFLIARRAVPAMALITLLSVIPMLMFLNTNTPGPSARFDEDTFFDPRGNSLPGAVLANREGLSGDDVFGLVVDRNERGSNNK